MTRVYRIGQIVPSSNTTMETEIPALLRGRASTHPDEQFTFHSSRMRMHRVTREELAKMNGEGARCAAELADARVDVMSTACLVAIMASGPGSHRRVEQELKDASDAAGASAATMTSAGALIDGLKALAVSRIALLAPYSRELTEMVVRYIEQEGIVVHDHRCFEIPDNLEVARRDPALLLQDAKGLDLTNVDAVVLSACVQMRSLPMIEEAQQRLGIPVTSTAVCTTWQMLKRLGLEARAANGGALLDGRAA